ncbi:MAG: CinA family nicotinamide mononucleotide deamidase-related protein [Deltaproteobacteria bacterium]|nr:CinA family nicotinamide mononucleotide deamidase-related protein [Deltaproteobacteria bacterium]
MRASILIIGNEIISGRTQDTNSGMIAREITARGWSIGSTLAVGDNYGEIGNALSFLLSKNEVIIVGGGLGPTADDITTEAIARSLNKTTFSDEKSLQWIKSLFLARNLPWTENNAKQAVFPTGAIPLENPVGSAWGYMLAENGTQIFVIPGPPSEAEAMLQSAVLPWLEKKFGMSKMFREVLHVGVFGISEARLDEMITEADIAEEGISVGFYPHFPEIVLLISAFSPSVVVAQKKIAAIRQRLHALLGRNAFSFSGARMEEELAVELCQKGLTLATAESCSGGLLGDRLTDVHGSSQYFLSGVVCYSNEEKIRLLGIPPSLIAEKGAVSEEVARLMAENVMRLSGSTLGVATTGIAGPAGGTPAKPVGTVFIAVCDKEVTVCRRFSFRWDRRRNKIITAQYALAMLREMIAVR